MKMELPSPVLRSLFSLNEAGYEAYVVGGCVRDAMMGKEPCDWDITTSALPEQTLAVFRDYRTIETGIQHGTVTVLIDDMPLEITTYRVDGDYSDGRHPDKVSFTRNLVEDLRRRDFTVNAMAYHPECGLVDPFDGRNDLVAKTIRCVGESAQRFQEDALRILRGLRFSSDLGFSIDTPTSDAIHSLAQNLCKVSAERISVELNKLICGKAVGGILQEYSDVLQYVLTDKVDYNKVSLKVSQVEATELARYTALLFPLTEETVLSVAKKLRFSNRFTNDLMTIMRNKDSSLRDDDTSVLRLLHHLEADLSRVLIAVRSVYDEADYSSVMANVERLIAEDACYTISKLAVNGEDLLRIGAIPGPTLGKTLSLLLDAVMSGSVLNEKEALLDYVSRIKT